MKKTLSFVILFWFFSAMAPAQSWVEERTYFYQGEAKARVNGLFTRNFSKKVGAFVWFQVASGYSQAYGGFTYSPKPWIQFAAGPGLEQAKNPARVGGYVWIGGKGNSLLLIAEYGGSGMWGKFEYNRKIGKYIGIGAMSERFKGTGPRVQVSISRTPITIWGAPLVYKGSAVGLLGIRVSF
ncbi:hypothetical protein D4R52_03720 [bacterium]|nr:MAG: hypothetical protein D4R52_03720 [bacterium]